MLLVSQPVNVEFCCYFAELWSWRCTRTFITAGCNCRMLHVVWSTQYQPAGGSRPSDWFSHGRAAGLLSQQIQSSRCCCGLPCEQGCRQTVSFQFWTLIFIVKIVSSFQVSWHCWLCIRNSIRSEKYSTLTIPGGFLLRILKPKCMCIPDPWQMFQTCFC